MTTFMPQKRFYTFKKDESIEPLMLLFIFGHKTFMDKTYNEA